jgi:hypothetical protein
MEALPTDFVLLRCRGFAGDGLAAAAQRFCAETNQQLHRLAWSDASGWMYLYTRPPAAVDRYDLAQWVRLWEAIGPGAEGTDASRLQVLQDLPGASRNAAAVHHYVVETDPEAGWEDEIARWYVEEHLKGLAAVPGCVHALRMTNLDGGPRSHACYALVSEHTLGCPPWLEVRGTAWSSRVRPHFTNTRRTMMAVVA